MWGWDNPFSYNKKMKEQELLTKQLKPGINMKYFHNQETINSDGSINKANTGGNLTAVNIGTFKKNYITTNEDGEIINGYNYFKYLVPGDIIWYDGHIMIVSSIKEPDGYDEDDEPYKRNTYMGEDYLTTNEETNPGQPPKCSWLIDAYGKFRNFTIDR